jgi:hypothetical protein
MCSKKVQINLQQPIKRDHPPSKNHNNASRMTSKSCFFHNIKSVGGLEAGKKKEGKKKINSRLSCKETEDHPEFCIIKIYNDLYLQNLQEDLAKFGYTSERKVEKFKNHALKFWRNATTYCLNMVTSQNKSS